MILTLAALSKAEKADAKFLTFGFFLASFKALFNRPNLFWLREVLVLSFLTFLIDDLIIGISGVLW